MPTYPQDCLASVFQVGHQGPVYPLQIASADWKAEQQLKVLELHFIGTFVGYSSF